MSYDIKCYTLAAHFIDDHPKLWKLAERVKELAQAIQDVIEAEIEDFETEDEGARMRVLYDAEKAIAPEDPTDPRSQAHAERMYEAADIERKRQREEGTP